MRRPQPLIIRITHWVNVPVLCVLAMSGLQIWKAYPHFGPQGARYAWPLDGYLAPEWLCAGGWLAGARHLHFLLAGVFVVNAIVYVAYVIASGEARRRWLWPRKASPPADYNRLQRLAYATTVVLALVEVLSGLAIYKPVQLSWLAAIFGGYDGARVVHFVGLVLLMLFIVGHVVMVLLHPRSLVEMVTGGKPQ